MTGRLNRSFAKQTIEEFELPLSVTREEFDGLSYLDNFYV